MTEETLGVEGLASAGILAQIEAGPKLSKSEAKRDVVENAAQESSKSIPASVLQAIKDSAHTLADELPQIVKVLNEIAKIHPFISLVAKAFEVAIDFELARRDNDETITALYMEMKDMVMALFQLKNIQLEDLQGDSKYGLQSELQRLSSEAANDIKACANICDTYAKSKWPAKLAHAYSWKTKLAHFVERFVKWKGQFTQTIILYIAGAISKRLPANKEPKISVFPDRTKIFGAIYDSSIEQKKSFPEVQKPEDSQLWQSIPEDPQEAISSNLKVFQRKFDLRLDQLEKMQDELSKKIDGVMGAIREGPYERIQNLELRVIWKEMDWKRNVPANLFVATLRDHFKEKSQTDDDHGSDAWAIKYIDTRWLQSILEAFDEDASGYITIAELNHFTESCPSNLKWSLEHWIAYWAIGQKFACQEYRDMIHDILDEMASILPYLPCQSRRKAEQYLRLVNRIVIPFTLSIHNATEIPFYIIAKFRPYMEGEERRIRENLEHIEYDVDCESTVRVVTGSDKPEKHVLPMIYVLLRHDLIIFKLAQTYCLDKRDFLDAAYNFWPLWNAMAHRKEDIYELFQQQGLNPEKQFTTFFGGILDYVGKPNITGNPRITMSVLSSADFKPVQKDFEVDMGQVASLLSYTNMPLAKLQPGSKTFIAKHYSVSCDGCHTDPVKGSRFICLNCISTTGSISATYEFCSLTCFQTSFCGGSGTHLPEHDLWKVQTPILSYRVKATAYFSALNTLQQSHLHFTPLDTPNQVDINSLASSKSPELEPICCKICKCAVKQPCWCCIQCDDYFLCNSCENDRLLCCVSCEEPYTQPTWYYGYGPADKFRCDNCSQASQPSPEELNDLRREEHTHAHSLVRCTVKAVVPSEPTMEERMRALERKAGEVDAKLDQILSKFSRLEQLLGQPMEGRTDAGFSVGPVQH